MMLRKLAVTENTFAPSEVGCCGSDVNRDRSFPTSANERPTHSSEPQSFSRTIDPRATD